MQKVFYSPGPFVGCSVYEVVDFEGVPTDQELLDTGQAMAYDHYESYQSAEEYEAETGMEVEYDYCWYEIDSPEVAGRI